MRDPRVSDDCAIQPSNDIQCHPIKQGTIIFQDGVEVRVSKKYLHHCEPSSEIKPASAVPITSELYKNVHNEPKCPSGHCELSFPNGFMQCLF